MRCWLWKKFNTLVLFTNHAQSHWQAIFQEFIFFYVDSDIQWITARLACDNCDIGIKVANHSYFHVSAFMNEIFPGEANNKFLSMIS